VSRLLTAHQHSWVSLYSAIHVGTRWKIQGRKQTINRHTTKTKHNPDNANNAKYSNTKLAFFSPVIRHSARTRGGLILQSSWPHTGPDQHINTTFTHSAGEHWTVC